MAQVGTITQGKDNYGLLIITITGLTGTGNVTPSFLSQGYPYGSYEIVSVTNVATDTVQLQGSNDGVNFANIGTAITMSTANVISSLALGGVDAPAKFYQFLLTGTGNYTITAVLMGTRG